MNESVKADLLYALSQAPELLKAGDAAALKELSDHTIHNAAIFQEQDSLSFAVVMYSLSKVIERAKDFNAAHAASLKGPWSFWTVFLAGKFLEEKESRRRVIATLVMLSGIMVTVLWG